MPVPRKRKKMTPGRPAPRTRDEWPSSVGPVVGGGIGPRRSLQPGGVAGLAGYLAGGTGEGARGDVGRGPEADSEPQCTPCRMVWTSLREWYMLNRRRIRSPEPPFVLIKCLGSGSGHCSKGVARRSG
jgi:hypothetical protein